MVSSNNYKIKLSPVLGFNALFKFNYIYYSSKREK